MATGLAENDFEPKSTVSGIAVRMTWFASVDSWAARAQPFSAILRRCSSIRSIPSRISTSSDSVESSAKVAGAASVGGGVGKLGRSARVTRSR